MLDPKTEDFEAVLIKTWGSSSSAVSSLLWFGILDTLPETNSKFEKLGPNCPKKGKALASSNHINHQFSGVSLLRFRRIPPLQIAL